MPDEVFACNIEYYSQIFMKNCIKFMFMAKTFATCAFFACISLSAQNLAYANENARCESVKNSSKILNIVQKHGYETLKCIVENGNIDLYLDRRDGDILSFAILTEKPEILAFLVDNSIGTQISARRAFGDVLARLSNSLLVLNFNEEKNTEDVRADINDFYAILEKLSTVELSETNLKNFVFIQSKYIESLCENTVSEKIDYKKVFSMIVRKFSVKNLFRQSFASYKEYRILADARVYDRECVDYIFDNLL